MTSHMNRSVRKNFNMATHLSCGRVNMNVLREAMRIELREFLDKCAGSKVSEGGFVFVLPVSPCLYT